MPIHERKQRSWKFKYLSALIACYYRRQVFKLNERSECFLERIGVKKAKATQRVALKSFELDQCGGEVGGTK